MSDTKDDFLMALMNVPSGCWVIPGWDVHRVMRALQEAAPAAPAPLTLTNEMHRAAMVYAAGVPWVVPSHVVEGMLRAAIAASKGGAA